MPCVLRLIEGKVKPLKRVKLRCRASGRSSQPAGQAIPRARSAPWTLTYPTTTKSCANVHQAELYELSTIDHAYSRLSEGRGQGVPAERCNRRYNQVDNDPGRSWGSCLIDTEYTHKTERHSMGYLHEDRRNNCILWSISISVLPVSSQ